MQNKRSVLGHNNICAKINNAIKNTNKTQKFYITNVDVCLLFKIYNKMCM